MSVLVAGTLSFLIASLSLAETLVVSKLPSSEFATIQAAIDSSKNGDVVLVGPGTYLENVDLLGKEIALRSASGPKGTVIDGSGAEPRAVIRCLSGETERTLIEGFTLTGGTGELLRSSPRGGGIFCLEANPTIRGNIVDNNEVYGPSAWGGGIFLSNENVGPTVIEGNIITNNFAELNGGGIFLAGDGTVRGNTVTSNQTGRGDGAGFYTFFGNVEVDGNIFFRNEAGDHGGGVYIGLSNPTFGSATVSNNVIIGNRSMTTVANDCSGSGVWVNGGPLSMVGNTIAFNSGSARSTYAGGGVCLRELRDLALLERNLIYRNNEGGIFFYRSKVRQLVRHNLFFENGYADFIVELGEGFEAEGNIFEDPMYCGLEGDVLGSVAGASPALNQTYGTIGAVETPGCGPFIAVSVEQTTWGGIKKLLSR